MSFLTVDDYALSIRNDTVREEIQEAGSLQRAYSGALRYDVRSQKRKWTMQTTPLDIDAVDTIRALIRGGWVDGWDWSDSGGATIGGVDPTAGTAGILSLSASDGNPIDIMRGQANVLAAHAAATNMLSTSEGECSNASDWALTYGSAADTSAGEGCLSSTAVAITPGGGVDWLQLAAHKATSIGSYYRAGMFVRASAAVTVLLSVRTGGTVGGQTSHALSADEWRWIQSDAYQSTSATGTPFLEITSDAVTVYIGGAKLYESDANNTSAPWSAGGTANTASTLRHNATALLGGMSGGYWIAGWARGDKVATPAAKHIFDADESGSSCRVSRNNAGAFNVYQTAGGDTDSTGIANASPDDTWFHFACGFGASGVSTVYINGALEYTGASKLFGDTEFGVGANSAGAEPLNGYISNFACGYSPFTPELAAHLYANGLQSIGAVKTIAGDIIGGESVQAVVREIGSNIVQTSSGNNLRVVELEISEL